VDKKRILAVVGRLAESAAEARGLDLVEVEFEKEPSGWYLRVFLDKQGGVLVEDCQAVSEELSRYLDEADPIPVNYFLEVSSPGLERPLKKRDDFIRYTGRQVEVSTYAPVDNQKEFCGELLGLEKDSIRLQLEDGRVATLPLEKVAKARLKAEF